MTVGRISVDLYAEQLGVPLNEVRSFRKSVGGTATNVAVATARLGHHTAVFTRLGDDPMGEYVRWALDTTFGVDTRYVGVNPSLPTPLAFATMEDPGEPVIVFYRSPQAPDMTIESADIDRDVVESVPILWFPTSSLSAEPSRTTIHDLLGVALAAYAHRARPRLAPAVLAFACRRHGGARPGARSCDDGDRQPRRVRGGGRRARPRPGRREAAARAASRRRS